MKEVKATLNGVSPLIMHNPQLCDPMNSISKKMKEITSKRKKTESDFMEMQKIEWHGSLYCKDKKPIIPGIMIDAMLVNAAKKNKLGQIFKSGVCTDGFFTVKYKGPKDLESLWEDENFRLVAPAVVNRSRIMRCRPIFNEWSLDITVKYFPDIVNESQIKDALVIGGQQCAIGDWRPRFGRFNVSF